MRNKDGEICKNCGHYVIWLSGWHHTERSQGQNTMKLDSSKKARIKLLEPQCKEPGCNCNNPEPVEK